MSTAASRHLKKLKSVDFNGWEPTFWLVKRKTVQRHADYTVLRVDIDAKLKRRFRSYLKDQLQGRDFHLDEYAFINSDTDDVLLTLDADATDFPKVEAAIKQGFDNDRVKDYDQLLHSWAYVILFEHGSERLYAWRKINAMTDPKKAISRKATFFQNHRLEDVEDKQVFLIDPRFDFFVHQGITFIANKREFESSMNFREGMKANGEKVLGELGALKFLSDTDAIKTYVGDNLHHLRKLSSIQKAGYYTKPDYVASLMKVCVEEKWELKIVNRKIVVEEESIDLLLKLLNNDRLRSPINNELFDSSAKKSVPAR